MKIRFFISWLSVPMFINNTFLGYVLWDTLYDLYIINNIIINNLRCNWSESPVGHHIQVMAEFSSNLVQLRTHILSKSTTQGTSHYNPDKDLIQGAPSIIHFVSWILICRHHRCIPNIKIITISKLYRSLTTSTSRL